MRIGIIGSGNIGGTLARHFARAGHEVMVSGREPSKAARLVKEFGPGIQAGSFADAASFGEIVVLSIPWQNAVLDGALPAPALFERKIVIDAMNPYRLDGSGLHREKGASSSERVAAILPGARIVKAFNTIYWEHLRDAARTDLPVSERRAVFIAGDDAAAKKAVSDLVNSIGFAPVDTGGLAGSVRQEPGSPIYNKPMSGAEAVAALSSMS